MRSNQPTSMSVSVSLSVCVCVHLWFEYCLNRPGSRSERGDFKCDCDCRTTAIRQTVEARLGSVRALCLGISAIYAGLLLWTCHAAAQSTDGWFLKTASIVGISPAAVVGYLNLSAARRLPAAGIDRRHDHLGVWPAKGLSNYVQVSPVQPFSSYSDMH